jgi:hypothetical protein
VLRESFRRSYVIARARKAAQNDSQRLDEATPGTHAGSDGIKGIADPPSQDCGSNQIPAQSRNIGEKPCFLSEGNSALFIVICLDYGPETIAISTNIPLAVRKCGT